LGIISPRLNPVDPCRSLHQNCPSYSSCIWHPMYRLWKFKLNPMSLKSCLKKITFEFTDILVFFLHISNCNIWPVHVNYVLIPVFVHIKWKVRIPTSDVKYSAVHLTIICYYFFATLEGLIPIEHILSFLYVPTTVINNHFNFRTLLSNPRNDPCRSRSRFLYFQTILTF